jgi:hypothetical protein
MGLWGPRNFYFSLEIAAGNSIFFEGFEAVGQATFFLSALFVMLIQQRLLPCHCNFKRR